MNNQHFDKVLATILLCVSLLVFLFMWHYGANLELLGKPWDLVMLFAGLLAGLIQGARAAQRNADANGAAPEAPQKS